MIGETVAHYQVLEKLGQGGMGVVYKARDVRLSRLVALKILRDDRTISHERQRRFLAEAQTASALNHPHIATIYDVQHNGDDIDFIAMEYIQGHSLDRLIGRGGLPVAEALRYAVAIADALAAAHAAGIVHRDLKPSNVMVSETGHVKVLDFGLAKRIPTSVPQPEASTQTLLPPETEEGAIVGTAAYMSPEQAGERRSMPGPIFSALVPFSMKWSRAGAPSRAIRR